MTDETCTGCEIGRRAFLRDAAMVAAALTAVGSSAEAMPLRLISALKANRAEATYPIPAGDSVSFDKDKEVILARSGKNVYAFALSRPHQNTALKWFDKDKRFQCPKHQSRYAPDGKYLEGRATRSMDRYQVRKDANNIVVNLDKLYEEDSDKVEWPTAFITV